MYAEIREHRPTSCLILTSLIMTILTQMTSYVQIDAAHIVFVLNSWIVAWDFNIKNKNKIIVPEDALVIRQQRRIDRLSERQGRLYNSSDYCK